MQFARAVQFRVIIAPPRSSEEIFKMTTFPIVLFQSETNPQLTSQARLSAGRLCEYECVAMFDHGASANGPFEIVPFINAIAGRSS